MSRAGTDAELIQQFEIYELELKQEDGDSPFKEQRYCIFLVTASFTGLNTKLFGEI